MISNTELLKKIDILEPLLKEILYMFIIEIEKIQEKTIDKTELNELKDIMKELALAQINTKETVKELADAQKRTEIRLDSLTQKMEELADAQKRTEVVVRRLAEAQERTDLKIEKIQQELGGISHSIGFSLENTAYKALPSLLKRDKDIDVKGRLLRKYYVYFDGTEEQIDIYGEGIKKDGNKICIIGEGKSQLGQKDITKFLKKIERLKKEITAEILPLMVTHIVTPEVERLLKDQDITCYLSYEF
jgi:hypothetical protein